MPEHICYQHDLLGDLLRGELPPDKSADVESAVASCERCSAALSELQRDADLLGASIREDISDDQFLEEPELVAVVQRLRTDSVRSTASVAGHTATEPEAVATPQSAGQSVFIRDYELLDKLGQGGMGEVYRARHARLKRIVAIKIMTTPRLRDARAVARFEREMEAIGRLDHPNIVRATDAGEVDGLHYLVMEYVSGCDVSTLAQATGPMRVADACEIVRQAALGLQHAYEHGQVHRDMKPSNLMVTDDGNVKILDMGLALVAEASSSGQGGGLTGSGQILGTIDYMAPEQAHDTRTVDVRADIYALGSTLYRLLTGAPPFGADGKKSTLERLQALTSEDPPPIAEQRADLSPELVALIHRMLSREPESRPELPADVARALSSFTDLANLRGLMETTADQREELRRDADRGIDVARLASPTIKPASAETNASGLDPTIDVVPHEHGEARSARGTPAATAVVTLLVLAVVTGAAMVAQSLLPDGGTGDVGSEHASKQRSPEVLPAIAHPVLSADVVQLSPQWQNAEVSFTRQGLLAAVGWDIHLWDVEQVTQLAATKHLTNFRRTQGGGVSSHAVSPDGTRLATGSWSDIGKLHIDLFQMPDSDLLRSFGETGETRHKHVIESIDFSPDGSQILTASRDGWVRLWDAATGEHLKALRGPGVPGQYGFGFARFVGSNKLIAHGGQGASKQLHVWDLTTDDRRDIPLPPESWTMGIADHGRRAILGIYYRKDDRREVAVVDIESGQLRPLAYEVNERVGRMALSPDGRRVLIADSQGNIEYWDVDQDRMIKSFGNLASVLVGMAISQDGRLGAASGQGGLTVFRLPKEDADAG